MTEHDTIDRIRKLVGYISDLLVREIAPTADNARLLEEADCLLTGVVSLLSEATDADRVFCRYTACGKEYCCALPAGVCTERRGTQTGACVVAQCPGVDTAIRAETDSHMAKG